jgi:signal transduction histidine kinase
VRASAALLGLINDISTFRRSGPQTGLESIDFDLGCLDDFAAAMAFRAHEKGPRADMRDRPGMPTRLRGGPGRLRQIVTNLAGA